MLVGYPVSSRGSPGREEEGGGARFGAGGSLMP